MNKFKDKYDHRDIDISFESDMLQSFVLNKNNNESNKILELEG